MIVEGFDTELLHIFGETAFKIATIVPSTYGAFSENEFFIGILIMNVVQFIRIPPVVMVSSPRNVLRGIGIFIDMQGVLLLWRLIIVVLVMFEEVYFNLSKAFV